MGGSIHINKTGSSIIDTVFVCRVTGKVPRRLIVEAPGDIANLVREDIERLRAGTVMPTRGDVRCILFGHMIRLAIWQLRHTWKRDTAIEEKLAIVARYIQNTGGFQSVEPCLGDDLLSAPRSQRAIVREDKVTYGTNDDDISFFKEMYDLPASQETLMQRPFELSSEELHERLEEMVQVHYLGPWIRVSPHANGE
jgi:hypothetical protein